MFGFFVVIFPIKSAIVGCLFFSRLCLILLFILLTVVAAAGVALVVAADPAALVADAVSVAGDSNRVAATATASAWR